MNKIYMPIQVNIEIEDKEGIDDNYFSIGFVFNQDIPHHIGLYSDELMDSIYIEADDQIYGFETKEAEYSINDKVLKLILLDENVFYWDNFKVIQIKIEENRIDEVDKCLKLIFGSGHQISERRD